MQRILYFLLDAEDLLIGGPPRSWSRWLPAQSRKARGLLQGRPQREVVRYEGHGPARRHRLLDKSERLNETVDLTPPGCGPISGTVVMAPVVVLHCPEAPALPAGTMVPVFGLSRLGQRRASVWGWSFGRRIYVRTVFGRRIRFVAAAVSRLRDLPYL